MSILIQKLYNPLIKLGRGIKRNMVTVLITCATAFMVLGSGFVVIAFDTNGVNYLILGSFLFAVAFLFYALGIRRAGNDDKRVEQRHQELLQAIKDINKQKLV